jgi:DedD protein
VKAAETPKTISVPVSKPRTTAAPPPSTQVSRAPSQAPKPAPAKVYNDYWVQTGSFEAKVRADNVKESLGAKGISSVIEVRDINSKTMYRVRVGPYTSQDEAKYWLELIQSIDGFKDSQIWQSQSVR